MGWKTTTAIIAGGVCFLFAWIAASPFTSGVAMALFLVWSMQDQTGPAALCALATFPLAAMLVLAVWGGATALGLIPASQPHFPFWTLW